MGFNSGFKGLNIVGVVPVKKRAPSANNKSLYCS